MKHNIPLDKESLRKRLREDTTYGPYPAEADHETQVTWIAHRVIIKVFEVPDSVTTDKVEYSVLIDAISTTLAIIALLSIEKGKLELGMDYVLSRVVHDLEIYKDCIYGRE